MTDLPSQVPPLTPGTSLKMTQACFGNFDKDRELLNIPKGKQLSKEFIWD